MIKRVIFDIDYTLLIPNYDREKEFFKTHFPKIGSYFINHVGEILKEYEHTHLKYEKQELLYHLNKYSEIKLDDNFLNKWFEFNLQLEKQNVREARELLEYFVNRNIDIVALSNWFTNAQKEKLKKVGLLDYFDAVYGGDIYLKPYENAYKLAIGEYKPQECLMIGDSLIEDVIAPAKIGIHSIYYTKNQEKDCEYQKVKRLTEVKNYF